MFSNQFGVPTSGNGSFFQTVTANTIGNKRPIVKKTNETEFLFSPIPTGIHNQNVKKSFFQEQQSPTIASAVQEEMKSEDVSSTEIVHLRSEDRHSGTLFPSDFVHETRTSQLNEVSSSPEMDSEDDTGNESEFESQMSDSESESDEDDTASELDSTSVDDLPSLVDSVSSDPTTDTSTDPFMKLTELPTDSSIQPALSTKAPIPVLPFDSHYLLVFFTTVELFGKTVLLTVLSLLETAGAYQEYDEHVRVVPTHLLVSSGRVYKQSHRRPLMFVSRYLQRGQLRREPLQHAARVVHVQPHSPVRGRGLLRIHQQRYRRVAKPV